MIASLTKHRSRRGLPVLGLAVVVFLAACGKPPPPKMPAVTAPIYVGEIAVVNRASKFVLIDLSQTTAPPDPGTMLTAITKAGESVRLKVSAERKAPFVTADIISGTPARGERVYR